MEIKLKDKARSVSCGDVIVIDFMGCYIDKPLKVVVESDNIKVEYEEETGRTNISFLL